MHEMSISVRRAIAADVNGIRSVHARAFPEGENETVAALALNLLRQASTPETISLVAESGHDVVGHVAFSPLWIEGRDDWRGYILAPLGVDPSVQGRGVGSRLVGAGIDRLRQAGVGSVFVYGDPDYYGRFGFDADTAAGFLPPHKPAYPFGWQALAMDGETVPTVSGRVSCVGALDDPALW